MNPMNPSYRLCFDVGAILVSPVRRSLFSSGRYKYRPYAAHDLGKREAR